jgi:superfamily II DNA or RNA helicase
LIILRDYQKDVTDKVTDAYKQGSRFPIIVASTGAGKTIMFSFVTQGTLQKGNAAVLIAHRKEIIKQISFSLSNFSIPHQIVGSKKLIKEIKSFHNYIDSSSNIIVGSVQTLVNHLDFIDNVMTSSKKLLVIVDECHHMVRDTQWGKVLDYCINNHKAFGLGVTATPARLDGKGLGKCSGNFADKLILAPPMQWLIDHDYLSPYKIFSATNAIDMSGAHHSMGDFATSEIEERANKPTITGDAIAEWKKHAFGLKTIIFCASIKHSQEVAAQFTMAGIPTTHIDGNTESDERTAAIRDFATGKTQCLSQVNLFSEGFDLSMAAQMDVTIDCVIDLSPTESLVMAMQRWGRALRPSQDKIAILLDLAGNVMRHGLPAMSREWNLDGIKKSKKNIETDITKFPVRTCPECFCVHGTAPICPECGYTYKVKPRKLIEQEGVLQEITEADYQKLQKKKEQGMAKTYDDLLALEKLRGYKPGWARHIFMSRNNKPR